MAIDRGKSQTASQLTGTVWRTLTQPGSLVSIQTAASEAAQLALTAQEGDVVIRSDEDKVYMHNSSYGGTMSDWTVFAVTNLIDEDDMATDSATKPPSQQSVKAYVDNQITAEDLDVDTDSGTIDIDLDSEILTIEGTGGQITTSASSTTVTLALESVLAGVTILPSLFTENATGSTELNFATYDSFTLTLIGNVVLSNPSSLYAGKSGYIAFIQDGTGSRTVTLGSEFETVGGSGLTLSSAADTTDLVPYFIAAAPGSAPNRILLGAPQLAFS